MRFLLDMRIECARSFAYAPNPFRIRPIPANGFGKRRLKLMARRPSQLLFDFRGVDRVPAIMAWTIRNKLDP